MLDYGAKGDNSTDNTNAFTQAIQAASAAGGATVMAPTGMYRFKGSIVVPAGVTLKGSYSVVPSHDLRGANPQSLEDGTVLVPTGGRGDETGTPFITIEANGAVAGATIWYAEQERQQTPVPYPWTIMMTGNNAAVMDVEVLGAWNAINATHAGRHYIARVQGQPLNIGVFVDSTYDIGRIEDVHFNPWFSSEHPFIEYQLTQGRAFVMGRSDWEYVFNTFAFGYAIGYHFINTPTGQMNGNFLGIGADLAINASVQVDASQAPGILITNGEFTAFHNKQWLPNSTVSSTHVVVGGNNIGPVKFVDSSFWGPASRVATLDGTGMVSFSSCQFVQWDLIEKDGRAAILANKGSLVVQGSQFGYDGTQIEIGPAVEKAVVMGNILTGAKRIKVANQSTPVAISNNL